MRRSPAIAGIAPSASPEEAVAIVAAVEQFMRDTAPAPDPAAPAGAPAAWARAGLLEGTGHAPGDGMPW